MVNRGPSGACVTCKKRRVKCDEARPHCGPCQRLSLQCGGYKTKFANLKFKDETNKVCARVARRQGSADTDRSQDRDHDDGHSKRQGKSHSRNLVLTRPLTQPDTAVPFYIQLYVSPGREMQSARGFFEMLIPIFNSQAQDSALTLAVSAVASGIQSLWRHSSFQSLSSPAEAYHTRAVKSLRRTLQDRNEWGKPATMLAVLALQWYENIAAVYGLRSATRIHHNGAVSLLPFIASKYTDGDDKASEYVRRFILHAEVSSALRQERPLQGTVYSWITGKRSIATADNPSAALDAIGASVAELQARYMQLSQCQTQTQSPLSLSASQDARDWIAEANHIDAQLVAWAENVPDHWRPVKLFSGVDIDASIPTYQSVCEIYPSCQIGAIWNLYRVQRLLLARIIITSLSTISDSSTPTFWGLTMGGEGWVLSDEFAEQLHTLQSLVDEICHCVPFYLGNRTRTLGITDFADETILLPSCQTQPAAKVHRSPTPTPAGHSRTPSPSNNEQLKRSLIAQGPWHLMSPLSRLLTFFSEEHGPLPTSLLRPGQHEWIRGQFLRVLGLLRILPGKSLDTSVEDLAQAVRKGAIFMSGP
ncbi:hypothetical protein BJX66DRAFT_36618 [Aspergillus keveii]|uniref:Zn(2)-C6 fungal-type domain-containing protein n=1 Tax=Aspergillus keveii TaxID=714993 RepID=A0ABR4FSW6_9EURO